MGKKAVRSVAGRGDREGIILAIDGGGTCTRCAAVDDAGAIVGFGTTGPANAVQCDPDDVRRNVIGAASAALKEAGGTSSRVRAVAAGLAGVRPDGSGGEFAVRCLRRAVGGARVCVIGDSVIALRGAIPSGIGVVAVAGTGSSVLGKGAGKAWIRAGGGGPLLGDEGSGYRIAVDALHAAWQARDGRGRSTALVYALASALRLARFDDAVRVLYGRGMGRDRIAALAKAVVQVGERGDAVALDIVRSAGHELGYAAATAAKRMGRPCRRIVSYQGALFDSSEAFRDAFYDAVRAAYPDAEIRPPVLPPLGGAYLEALDALGMKATEAMMDRCRRDLNARLSTDRLSRR
jgi:N-acetylglucosamine kinase-like BadF-type ATPase